MTAILRTIFIRRREPTANAPQPFVATYSWNDEAGLVITRYRYGETAQEAANRLKTALAIEGIDYLDWNQQVFAG